MSYIEGECREQTTLFPESIEDFVDGNHPVRFIDAFVESLDLVELGFKRALPTTMGRPAYHPSDLLKLWLYGYFYKIRSSRTLARETHRNVELFWLVKRLRPDFRTIADFRKDNRKAIHKLFGQFMLLCHKLDLIGEDLIAIDGSKFKGVNSKKRNLTQSRIKMLLRRIDKDIQKYLNQLDETDQREKGLGSFLVENGEEKLTQLKAMLKEDRQEIQKKLQRSQEKKRHLEQTKEEFEKKDVKQVSLTDPDSRKMKTSQGALVGYNVQTAVDEKHHLIVAVDVSQDTNDQNQLSSMVHQTKEVIKNEHPNIVADKGYFKEAEIAACEEIANVYVPKPEQANTRTGLFPKAMFLYNAKENTYKCPAGQILTERAKYKKTGEKIYTTTQCSRCPLKEKCTPNQRTIRRSKHADAVDRMTERLKHKPDMMKKRQAMVEHPFGTIKSSFGYRDFLTKGMESVRAEMSLAALIYNLKRVINVLGVEPLLASLT